MRKRKWGLLAAEILLIAVLLLAMFTVEGAVVANWFSSSMRNALNKVISSINESANKNVDDINQQLWAEERLVTLAAYYLENDAADTDTGESLSDLCLMFNADGAYLIHRNGKIIAGCGIYAKEDIFQDESCETLRSVSKDKPCSDPVFFVEPSDDSSEDSSDEELINTYPFFISCHMDSG